MIKVDALTRRYGRLTAVDGVSFAVGRGEIVGFLGPNGAGKSTVLRVLATFLAPSAGHARIDNLDVETDSLAVRRRIGYLPGDTPGYPAMRVADFLRFVATARGLEGPALSASVDRMVERFGLSPALHQRLVECSTGYRQRVGLAAALVHDPPVLLLDEPTHGFDPLQVLAFRQLLRDLRGDRAILFSTHIVADVEAVSDRVLVIHRGRLLGDGTPAELARQAGTDGRSLEVTFAELVRASTRSRDG